MKLSKNLEHDTRVLFGTRDDNNTKFLYKCSCNKKAPSEYFFLLSFLRCAPPFVQLPIKFPYIFCSFLYKHVRETGTYFLFIFSLFISAATFLANILASKMVSYCSDSRMNVLNVYFAPFRSILFLVCAQLQCICVYGIGIRKNIYGKIIIFHFRKAFAWVCVFFPLVSFCVRWPDAAWCQYTNDIALAFYLVNKFVAVVVVCLSLATELISMEIDPKMYVTMDVTQPNCNHIRNVPSWFRVRADWNSKIVFDISFIRFGTYLECDSLLRFVLVGNRSFHISHTPFPFYSLLF